MTGILHVVLVRWTADDASLASAAEALVDEHLPQIDGVEHVDRGPAIESEGLEDGLQWMLAVRFRDRAALDGYLPHPHHAPVADYLRTHSQRVVVLDTETA